MTDSPDKPVSDKEKTADQLDDESLIDRLFPDELIAWVKARFGADEEE